MTVSIESWKTMIANGNDACIGMLGSLAESGDVDSVMSAVEADIRIGDDEVWNRARVLTAVTDLLATDIGAARKDDVRGMLSRLLERYGDTAAADRALWTMVDKRDDVNVPAIEAMVAAGGNPFACRSAKDGNPVERVFGRAAEKNTGFARREAPGVLSAMLGTGAITSLANAPACRFAGLPAVLQVKPLSVLEAAILLDYGAVVEKLKSRIPEDNVEVRQQLGDRVLALLGISITKGDVKRKPQSTVAGRDRDSIAAVCRLINAGAEMRDGDAAWKAVATRVSAPFEEAGSNFLPSLILALPFNAEGDYRIEDDEVKTAFFNLVDKGCVDLDKLDMNGFTYLMEAVWRKDKETVEKLLERGADASVASTSDSHSGLTAVEILRKTSKGVESGEILALLQAATAKAAVGRVLRKRHVSAMEAP